MKYSPWFTEPKEPPLIIVSKKELGDSPILREISIELKKLVKIEEDIYELHSAKGRKTTGKVYA